MKLLVKAFIILYNVHLQRVGSLCFDNVILYHVFILKLPFLSSESTFKTLSQTNRLAGNYLKATENLKPHSEGKKLSTIRLGQKDIPECLV